MEIILNMKGSAADKVTQQNTALTMGSGSLPVYATPSMAALMEKSACNAIASGVPDDKTSVGIELNLKHTAATPVGMEVKAEATVTAVEKNIISFTITAYDQSGVIGTAEHKRALVTTERFVAKTNAKL